MNIWFLLTAVLIVLKLLGLIKISLFLCLLPAIIYLAVIFSILACVFIVQLFK